MECQKYTVLYAVLHRIRRGRHDIYICIGTGSMNSLSLRAGAPPGICPPSARPRPNRLWSTTSRYGTRSSAVGRPSASGSGRWGRETRTWITALLCLCTFCGRQAWTAPSCASACPDFLRWTTTGWAGVSLKLWRTWDAGRCSSPAATCLTN